MKTLIRIIGVLIIVIGLAATFFSLFPLVYFINKDVAINELADFALRMGDLQQRYKRQLLQGSDFILTTMYQNAMVFVCSWLFFLLALAINFWGAELLFLRELARKAMLWVSSLAAICGVVAGMLILQLMNMLNSLITLGSRDLDKYAVLANLLMDRIMAITLGWVILHGLIIYFFTRTKVQKTFLAA